MIGQPVKLSIVVLSLFFAGEAAAGGQLSAHEREPLVVYIPGAKTASSSHDAAEILRAVARAIEPNTSLEVLDPAALEIDTALLDRCGRYERLSCWIQTVRPDYDRSRFELANGAVEPFGKYLDSLRANPTRYARYLLVVSVIGAGVDGGRRYSTLVIDTDEALEIFHKTERELHYWVERVEDKIFQRLRRAHSGPVSRREELDSYFREVDTEARPMFQASGHLRPYGAISIADVDDGLVLELDGKSLGLTSSTVTTVVDVLPGVRRVRLADPSGRRGAFSTSVTVERNKTVEVSATFAPPPDPAVEAAHTILFWTGVATVAAGVGLGLWAAAGSRGEIPLEPCVGDACPGAVAGFATFCELTSEQIAGCDGGLEAAPLSGALFVGGGVWALATALVSDDQTIPWWQVASGIALGVGTYAFMSAVY